ncbi:hypothetical protein ACLPJG_26685 [Pseudomonas aeruginosa]
MTSKPDNVKEHQAKGGQAKTSDVAATAAKYLDSQAPKEGLK